MTHLRPSMPDSFYMATSQLVKMVRTLPKACILLFRTTQRPMPQWKICCAATIGCGLIEMRMDGSQSLVSMVMIPILRLSNWKLSGVQMWKRGWMRLRLILKGYSNGDGVSLKIQQSINSVIHFAWLLGDAPVRYATLSMFFDIQNVTEQLCGLRYTHQGSEQYECPCVPPHPELEHKLPEADSGLQDNTTYVP